MRNLSRNLRDIIRGLSDTRSSIILSVSTPGAVGAGQQAYERGLSGAILPDYDDDLPVRETSSLDIILEGNDFSRKRGFEFIVNALF